MNPNIEVEMFVEFPEGIVDLGIITKEFMGGYCILLETLMHRNVDTALLWLRLLSEYLVNEYKLSRSKADSCIFFGKDEKWKLDLFISVHVDDIFIACKPETIKNK